MYCCVSISLLTINLIHVLSPVTRRSQLSMMFIITWIRREPTGHRRNLSTDLNLKTKKKKMMMNVKKKEHG